MPNITTPQIVNLTATLTVAPTPSQLQRSGTFISTGATTLASGSYQFLSQLSDLTPILNADPSVATQAAELTAMATTFFAQGNSVGVYVLELGTQTNGAAGIEALQAWITANPGVFYAYLVPAAWDNNTDVVGSIIIDNGGTGYVSAPSVTITGGGGSGATATAVVQNGAVTSIVITTPGDSFTTAPTVTIDAPPTGGTQATAHANLASELDVVAGDFANPTAKTYFFITTTVANVGIYQPNKSVCAFVPSPLATSQEYGASVYFYNYLVNNPGPANQLAPMQYRYAYGVTPWPAKGYAQQVNTILSAYGNIIYPCSEAGISNTGQWKGTFSDGSQMSWWYGVDWFQIQVAQSLAAAVINGSNSNPPLLYDQNGINTLHAVANTVLDTAITYGCLEGGSITATSFATYTQQNPDNYKAGIYGGFLATVSGQNGFLQISFYMDATQFAL